MDLRTHTSWDAWLGSLTTERLATLLHLRPDVAVPPPTSLVVLSTRLTQQRSYRRALSSLNRPQLAFLATVATGNTQKNAGDHAGLSPVLPGATDCFPYDTQDLATSLQNYALLYPSDDDGYLLPPGLPDVLSQLPLDLLENPPLRDCSELRAHIALLPPKQRQVLKTLAESGRKGHATGIVQAPPDHPLQQLLAAELLTLDKRTEDTVQLPEDVYSALHHSIAAAHEEPLVCPTPKQRNSPTAVAHLLASTTAGSFATGLDHFALLLHTLRELITTIDNQPLHALADGGIGQRELRRLATNTGLATDQITIGLEALAALGIIEESLLEDGAWTTTITADAFLAVSPAEQWDLLIRTWWHSPRPWGGTPHERALVLNPHAADSHLLAIRHQLLESLTLWPTSLHTAEASDVAALTHWNYPLIPALAGGDAFRDTLQVAEMLGLLHSTTLTQVGRSLFTGELAETIASHIPPETTSILVQDDYTVLVQGFLSPAHTDTLRRFAKVESPGMATLYRITEESIRHALDTGLTATDIHTFLQDLSVNAVPQALGYLIDDAARRHGALRVAPALSVVHSDDPALIRTVMAAPAVHHCGLRSLAPTVAIADVTPRELHSALQQAGFSPILEDHHGGVLALRHHRPRPLTDNPYRSPVPTDDSLTTRSLHSQLSQEQVLEIANRLQAAEDNSRNSGPMVTGEGIIPTLQEAITSNREVILGFIKGTGVEAQIRLLPQGMSGGRLDAMELATRQPYRFALHKIRSVRIVTDE